MEDNKRENTFGQKAAENTIPSIEDLLRDVESEASIPALDPKELEKQINRRITAIVTRVLVILAVCVALLLCIIHPVMKLVTYNYKAKAKTEGEYISSELVTYLHAYTSVFMPYLEVYDAEVEERGFGRYTLHLYTTDHRERFVTTGYFEDLDTFQVFGKYWDRTDDNDQRFVHMIGRFYGHKTPEEVVPDLEELPDSAMIYCFVTLPEAVLPEELWQEGIDILWLRVDQQVNEVDAGIQIARRVYWTDDIRYREQMTGVQLKDEFLAELELIMSDKELLEILGIPHSDRGEDGRIEGLGGGCKSDAGGVAMVEQLYQAALSWDTIRTREICLSGKKADVLAYIETMNVEGIYVENVRMSQWSD